MYLRGKSMDRFFFWCVRDVTRREVFFDRVIVNLCVHV